MSKAIATSGKTPLVMQEWSNLAKDNVLNLLKTTALAFWLVGSIIGLVSPFLAYCIEALTESFNSKLALAGTP
jgi:hypothetical protein